MACCSKKKTDGKELQSINDNNINDDDDIPEKLRKLSISLEIEYLITIKTSDNRNASTNGPVYLTIIGRDDKQTDDLLLEGTFKQDSIRKCSIKSKDIGKPQRIIIRHEDRTSGWFLDYVEIFVHNFLIRFTANRWLNESKHDRKLSVELFSTEQPAMNYTVEVRTGNEQIDGFDSPVYIQLFGTITNTPKIYLESKYASFAKNSTAKFHFSTNNVGNIENIIIGHENFGNVNEWFLKTLKIQTNTFEHEFTVHKCLSPARQLFIELNPQSLTPVPETEEEFIYFISIKVDSIEKIESILLNIHGSNGNIETILSKGAFQSTENDTIGQVEIQNVDIGNIENLSIDLNNNLPLVFESIDIKYQDHDYHFPMHCKLIDHIKVKPISEEEESNYRITIEYETCDGNLILSIFGEEDVIRNYLVKPSKNRHNRFEFNIRRIDVGTIIKLAVGIDEGECSIRSIEIEKDEQTKSNFPIKQLLSKDTISYIEVYPQLNFVQQALYTITIMTSTEPESGTDSGVFMTIFGENNKTNRIVLSDSETRFNQGDIYQFEMDSIDVGDIKKINIGQDGRGLHPIWHLQTVEIQKGTETYKFHADQILDFSMLDIDLEPIQNVEKKVQFIETNLQLPNERSDEIPSLPSIIKFNSKPQQLLISSSSQTSTVFVKSKGVDYHIKTITGKQSFESNVTIKIRGDSGKVSIPLSTTNNGTQPFQANATDLFVHRENDVGKIKRIIIEHDNSKENQIWNLKKIFITKGKHSYKFNVNACFDDKHTKLTLSPNEEQREDYVQSELRRLRQSLRIESAKMRRPTHKAHEPFVYNDLRPYFDTTTVEKAIQEPLDSMPGYHTRLTALRVVEPWEAHGMDYGVSYELIKKRGSRGSSGKRTHSTTQHGMMMLPPLLLPFGGQMTYVNPSNVDNSPRSSSTSKHRSNSRKHSAKRKTNT